MHVNFATLRGKYALESWICDLEPLHGSNQVCMEKELTGLGESQHDSAGHMKMVVNSTSWMNKSVSPMKITIKLDELKKNLTSRMRFP